MWALLSGSVWLATAAVALSVLWRAKYDDDDADDYDDDNDYLSTFFVRPKSWLSSLNKLSYQEHLRCLGLPSLELRHLYTDLIWCYKIVFGLVDLQFDDFLT